MEVFTAADGQPRCTWCRATPAYIDYHDTEWGYPVVDDIRLFEKICLEGFQAGLSWRTILEKRENFRRAFAGFDFHQVATYTEQDVERLLQDAGIIRHRGKIEATINNARRAQGLVAEFGTLAHYFWQFEEDTSVAPVVRATSPMAIALSTDLKKRGWKFVGSTTMYAFMQAMGLVNDHGEGCMVRAKVAQARAALSKP